MLVKSFGQLPDGRQACLYTIRFGNLEAAVTDFGATLVSLLVPDKEGHLADVVLGFDSAAGYAAYRAFMGATIGRNANRIAGGSFSLNGKTYALETNNKGINLHSGRDSYAFRMWNVAEHTETSIRLTLESPDGDQGFPGNAHIQVTYTLEHPDTLRITHEGICDADTIFNMTNHAYFNLAGHNHPERAMEQVLGLSSEAFVEIDGKAIPTGQLQKVAGSPMDFRVPKILGKDIDADYNQLKWAAGYDHCYVVSCASCATLSDTVSGRTMQVVTDCPGVQVYTANGLGIVGKAGIFYPNRSAVCLETQYYPDAVHHSQWPQPIVKAGEKYLSETKYIFG